MTEPTSCFYEPKDELIINNEKVVKAVGYNGKHEYTEYTFRHKQIGLVFKNNGDNFWFIHISDNIHSDCLGVFPPIPGTGITVSWGYKNRKIAEKNLEKWLPLVFDNGVREFKLFKKFIEKFANKKVKDIFDTPVGEYESGDPLLIGDPHTRF
jgi:hypothetical protein